MSSKDINQNTNPNRKKKYQTLLFDMDGTLADTDPMIIETFHILYDEYRNGDRRPDSEIVYFSGPPIRETLKKEFPELDQKMIFDVFHKVSRSLYDTHIFPYPHEREVLLKLKEAGFHLGVVTNKTHDLTLVALDIINLGDVFEFVVGSTDVSKTKPAPEGLLKAMEHFGSDRTNTLYVGDTKIDLDSAVNAGIDCCLVNWGPRKLPPESVPTFKISSYLDLEDKVYE